MAGVWSRIFGVDFSGASEPGMSIWLTEAVRDGATIRVLRCDPARAWLSLPRSADRSWVYRELRDFVKDRPDAVFGFDFPFGLPQTILGQVDSWEGHIRLFGARFRTTSANAFRRSCVDAARATTDSSDSRLYHRRETDMRYAAQSPYLPQIQYQTLYGQTGILAPFLANEAACVVPMQEREEGKPTLVEVYPAATLGVLRLYRQGYKTHAKAEERRKRILQGLRSQGFHVPDGCSDAVRDSDDALDSVLAAVGAFHAASNGFRPVEEEAYIEGQIFA